MKCTSCDKDIRINFGNASRVLCQSCNDEKKDLPEESVTNNAPASNMEKAESNYSTAIGVANILMYCGWFIVAIGIIAAFMGLGSISKYATGLQILISTGPGIGVAISGLFMVATSQVTRAVVDTADNSREMLKLLQNKNN